MTNSVACSARLLSPVRWLGTLTFCLLMGMGARAQAPGTPAPEGAAVWTPQRAEQWLKRGDWKNGLRLRPHETVNAVSFAVQYHLNRPLWDLVFDWLQSQPLETLAPGKYPIDGDRAFAILTEGPTKPLDSAKWESHQQYIDFQYVVSGREQIGLVPREQAVTTEPFVIGNDNAHYRAEGTFYTAMPGTFFLFFPQDVHRPNIRVDGRPQDKKLVIKIRMAEQVRKVTLDYYFNHEWQKTSDGNWVRYHYTWEDTANSGFSKLGSVFRKEGFVTDTLAEAPNAENLKSTAVYVIVDPDTEQENPHPDFVSPADVTVLRKWVQAGGVLVLMGNDKGNAEFKHFNQLAGVFGLLFNEDCVNHVIGDDLGPGKILVAGNNPIFSAGRELYMKDVSSIRVNSKGIPILSQDKQVIMATARYGKGTVLAVGDPWIYNEYIDNHRLPAEFQNQQGAVEWVKWLKRQVPE